MLLFRVRGAPKHSIFPSSIFARLRGVDPNERRYVVRVKCMEIYKEQGYDLLDERDYDHSTTASSSAPPGGCSGAGGMTNFEKGGN